MKEPAIAQIEQAAGLNTYAARGSVPAPFVLLNALLRPGGWACAPQARSLLADALYALWSGEGQYLYAQRASDLKVVLTGADGGAQVLDLPPSTSLRDAVLLAPRLVQIDEQTYLAGDKVVSVLPKVTAWGGAGTKPTGPYYTLSDTNPQVYRIVPIQGINRVGPPHPYVVPLTINTPGVAEFRNFPYHVEIYRKVGEQFIPYVTNSTGTRLINPDDAPLPLTGGAIDQEQMTVRVSMAEFHNGRVWYTASNVTTSQSAGESSTLTPPRNRIYFSDVAGQFSDTVLPAYGSDYYFDLPFRVSTSITAIKSVGRYLYVFGERELWVISGNDDQTWQLESLGDSIGTLAPRSVQAVRGAMFYLSEGNVLAVSGGNVQNVGDPIRDLLRDLSLASVTATVDFERELYFITDGRQILTYHLLEQGWTQREMTGSSERLLYLGGAPATIAQQGGDYAGVFVFDSPDLLPMTLKAGPFGVVGWRPSWRGAAGAVDSDGEAVTTFQVDGVDLTMDWTAAPTPGAPQARPAHAGVTPHMVSLGANTALLQTLTVTLTPATGTRRCVLRPPLGIVGSGGKEAWA
ncbi:hypothetical protein [Deinococcus sp. Leaf326]|uniref:hypothetical protein n=1 Tax=Deinococcus sp. Leaf326 TaxID=1736338 RepID=UPI0006F79DB5|nr:hypothetical protein [Deinococcus sp. Leaf326]KQR22864.1 hypothetical protein ASF71_06775 [Deinococcus sp. Leaf326]